MIIKDCYERNMATIDPETTVSELKKYFEHAFSPTAAVVNKEKKAYLGILHFEDLFDENLALKSDTITARDLAKHIDFFVFEDDILEDVSSLLMETHEEIVPVLNSELAFCGVISVFDILELLNDMLSSEKDTVSFSLTLKDKPGSLKDLIVALGKAELNIVSIIAYPNDEESKKIFIKVDSDDINHVRTILKANRLRADYVKKRLGT
ncbi:MAG TPA: CBS domain-containing protein [Thermotogota bacterium]|nr:CBS domain-containing protein [Thermotogota bacterium]HPJ88646.1 CBS domain-containing protein [Thermotogota bacterium]HPR95816.1 CBS domain-containing protein [Thermotogota bacterium]